MVLQLCEYTKKITDLYTLSRWILYVNYILKKKKRGLLGSSEFRWPAFGFGMESWLSPAIRSHTNQTVGVTLSRVLARQEQLRVKGMKSTLLKWIFIKVQAHLKPNSKKKKNPIRKWEKKMKTFHRKLYASGK